MHPTPPNSYVAGLMFDLSRSRVALIRKRKPRWQANKLNAIGGKIEPGEESIRAMAREFGEETGFLTSVDDWRMFLSMGGENDDGAPFQVDFYVYTGAGVLENLRTTTDEPIEVIEIAAIHIGRRDMLSNAPWVIGLALDHLVMGPRYVFAHYQERRSSVGPCRDAVAIPRAFEAMRKCDPANEVRLITRGTDAAFLKHMPTPEQVERGGTAPEWTADATEAVRLSPAEASEILDWIDPALFAHACTLTEVVQYE